MPENQIPATQPQAGSAAGEFNFANPESDTPRIKKRNLKTKVPGLIKPNPAALPAARELEREAPPVTAEQASKPVSVKTEEVMAKAASKPVVKAAEAPTAPPRTMPSTSSSAGPTPAKIASTATPSFSTATGPASSPHGTRPATLYYTSPARKAEPAKVEPGKVEAPKVETKAEPVKAEPVTKAETPTSMKTIPTAASSSSNPRIATTATASTSRPSVNVDYRANVERQSREQKSVGSILSYVVYGLIAFFVISAGLALYGADVIFKQLHEQSSTVADLDAHYTKLTSDLSTKLSATQDQLTAAQSQITRQQDVILKQQEQLNQILTSTTANDAAIKAEKAARAQETATIRARLNKVEARTTAIQKY
jgi:hypothetical protein